MKLITCQHEWVEHCQVRYRCDPPSKEFSFQEAHYPLSERLGEVNTVYLWYPDHIVQGVLQTAELSYPCIYTGKRKSERVILEHVYPEYVELYDQAYSFCQAFSGRRRGLLAHRQKNEDGKSIKAITFGKMMAQRNHSQKDEFGRSVVAMKLNEKAHAKKTPDGKSLLAVEAAARMNSYRYEDPDHPELGRKNPGALVQMQRARGLPHGRENRVRVYQDQERV